MNNHEQNETASANYQLKSDAVEQLVNAKEGNTPQYSKEELEKYRSKSKIKIPDSVKILFIKTWFPGAVCFFFLWGLGSYISSLLDMLFILGVVLGAVTDLMVNSIIRFIEKFPGENEDWMVFGKKGTVSFFLNIVYSFLIIYCVYTLYNIINVVAVAVTGAEGTVPVGVEPILFGLLCMGVDMVFVGMKRLFKSILADAKAAARVGAEQDSEDSST